MIGLSYRNNWLLNPVAHGASEARRVRGSESVATLLLLAMLVTSCGPLERMRQKRTFIDMQLITQRIEMLRRDSPGSLGNPIKMRALIGSIAHGRDAWGRSFLFFTRGAKGGPSYVLVSTGSDGRRDVGDESSYFTMPERIIHDEPWRDIVFRDGRAVTLAGK
jgi:hypothetical protein